VFSVSINLWAIDFAVYSHPSASALFQERDLSPVLGTALVQTQRNLCVETLASPSPWKHLLRIAAG
jgi:hypothetical protein